MKVAQALLQALSDAGPDDEVLSRPLRITQEGGVFFARLEPEHPGLWWHGTTAKIAESRARKGIERLRRKPSAASRMATLRVDLEAEMDRIEAKP